MNENLIEIDSYKNQLLASVTHDLRTPLSSISAYVDIMLEDVTKVIEGSKVN